MQLELEKIKENKIEQERGERQLDGLVSWEVSLPFWVRQENNLEDELFPLTSRETLNLLYTESPSIQTEMRDEYFIKSNGFLFHRLHILFCKPEKIIYVPITNVSEHNLT